MVVVAAGDTLEREAAGIQTVDAGGIDTKVEWMSPQIQMLEVVACVIGTVIAAEVVTTLGLGLMVEGAGAQGEEVGVDMAIAVVLYLAALWRKNPDHDVMKYLVNSC
jgi:hypothetical protein